MSNPARSEEEITTILMALVAWAGQVTPASKYLQAEFGIGINPRTLQDWKLRYAARYDEMREKYAADKEQQLVHNLRDLAGAASDAAMLGVEKAKERLEAGRDDSPAQSAASLAKVAQTSTDKLLTLTNRPTTISETRNVQEILRSLVAKGVLSLPEEPVQIEGSVDG